MTDTHGSHERSKRFFIGRRVLGLCVGIFRQSRGRHHLPSGVFFFSDRQRERERSTARFEVLQRNQMVGTPYHASSLHLWQQSARFLRVLNSSCATISRNLSSGSKKEAMLADNYRTTALCRACVCVSAASLSGANKESWGGSSLVVTLKDRDTLARFGLRSPRSEAREQTVDRRVTTHYKSPA